jgi:hypothetical protein
MHVRPALAQLNPTRAPSYSRNLYRWLKEFGRESTGTEQDLVYRVADGTQLAKRYGTGELMIGSPFSDNPSDPDFFGARVSIVLSEGEKAERWCYPGVISDLILVPDFWGNYMRVGRCAIDPAHELTFSGLDRFDEHDNTRTCRWCGVQQYKERIQRIVYDERWIDVTANFAEA